jgi:hypothetical protein
LRALRCRAGAIKREIVATTGLGRNVIAQRVEELLERRLLLEGDDR